MAIPYGARSYVHTQARTATPLQLVVLLYDTALRSATTASDAMQRRDIPTRRAALNKLMDVIGELQSTLDLERGGRIAEDLDGLYRYLIARLLEAIARQDAAPIDEVHGILLTLRDGWQHIASNPAATQGNGHQP